MTKRIELKNQEDDSKFDNQNETADKDPTLETTWKAFIYSWIRLRTLGNDS